jgi:glycosyltransferase involved in cell wall biosynthesis
MRILIINSEYPPIGGGAGNASENLAKRFVALRQDVVVVTVNFNDMPGDSVENQIRVIRIKSLRQRQDRSGPFEQVVFLAAGSIGGLNLLRKWRPDVILAFFGVPGGAVAWLIKKLSGIPYLVSLRGGDVPGFRPYDFAFYHRLIGPLLHIVWKEAGGVVANSQGLKELAVNFDRNVDINIVPNGVDVGRFVLNKNRDWDKPRLLWVGRLVYQKGLDILFNALGGLSLVPWTLTLVGDGPQRNNLEQIAIRREIVDRIEFLGWLPKDELLRHYRDSNLFVFPSRHEGMPNSVLEAMASGLPVIASDISGNEELVIPGITGLLVPPGDTNALEDALRDLLSDPVRRKQMGSVARERVENHYTWDQVARKYLSLLQEIVD